jgi:hypothetical protein
MECHSPRRRVSVSAQQPGRSRAQSRTVPVAEGLGCCIDPPPPPSSLLLPLSYHTSPPPDACPHSILPHQQHNTEGHFSRARRPFRSSHTNLTSSRRPSEQAPSPSPAARAGDSVIPAIRNWVRRSPQDLTRPRLQRVQRCAVAEPGEATTQMGIMATPRRASAHTRPPDHSIKTSGIGSGHFSPSARTGGSS